MGGLISLGQKQRLGDGGTSMCQVIKTDHQEGLCQVPVASGGRVWRRGGKK